MESKSNSEKHHQAPEGRSSITLGTLSDVGRVRTVNEDSFYALAQPDSPEGIDALLVVADGMGGREAGEVASSMAVSISSPSATTLLTMPMR